MELLKMARQLKPLRGQRLADWLKRFLTASPDQLDNWSGKFTEIITAKAVAILRKRGLVDEHEANQILFGRLVNAAYRAPVYKPAETVAAPSQPATQNPLLGLELNFVPGEYEEKNRNFFLRLCGAQAGTGIVYYVDDNNETAYYDLIGISGEHANEAIPVPVFAQITGVPEHEIPDFLFGWFEFSRRTREDWQSFREGLIAIPAPDPDPEEEEERVLVQIMARPEQPRRSRRRVY